MTTAHQYRIALENMITNQILPQKITDTRVIDAIASTPRHEFAPAEAQATAYADSYIETGHGRYMMPPAVFATMLQAADIQPEDTVLDIACGCGYSSAVIAKLAARVIAVEPCPDLCSKTHQMLKQRQIENSLVIENPLSVGHPDEAPYSVIMIEGAVKEIPSSLLNQLADGGRLIAAIQTSPHTGHIAYVEKEGEFYHSYNIGDCQLPLIPELKA